MSKMLGWGTLPTREEFTDAFYEKCPEGYYEITHNTPNTSDARPPAARFNATALWYELERLKSVGTDEAYGWIGDILYTLGWEWI